MSEVIHLAGKARASSYTMAISRGTATTDQAEINTAAGAATAAPAAPKFRSSANVEAAVYSYIRALRALGKKRVNTNEIAVALGLTTIEVDATLSALQSKGVKPKR